MSGNPKHIGLNEALREQFKALSSTTQKIVHDTNNYYGVIQGYLSLIEMGVTTDQDIGKYLPPMYEALKLGIELNKKLGAFYQSSDLMYHTISLPEVAQKAIGAFEEIHSICPQLNIAEDIGDVVLDINGVNTILTNMCLLAKKCGTGSQLTISHTNLSCEDIARMILPAEEDAYIGIELDTPVSDNFPGDSLDYFAPFSISDDSQNDVGLALIFNIASNHHGTIDLNMTERRLILSIYLHEFAD